MPHEVSIEALGCNMEDVRGNNKSMGAVKLFIKRLQTILLVILKFVRFIVLQETQDSMSRLAYIRTTEEWYLVS